MRCVIFAAVLTAYLTATPALAAPCTTATPACTEWVAPFLGGALDNTVVIAPRFASNNGGCSDTLAEREANWECGGPARWTAGGVPGARRA